MTRIFISSCLLGERVKYNGYHNLVSGPELNRWMEESVVISGCPETAGGLPVPRPPAEITRGDGYDVINEQASVMDDSGVDVTDFFLKGARETYDRIRNKNAVLAVLKSGSPSCGNHKIYDGNFSGQMISGSGVTSAYLENKGIRVFNEHELKLADLYFRMCCMNSTRVSFRPLVSSDQKNLIRIQEENLELLRLLESSPDIEKDVHGMIQSTDLPPGGKRNHSVNLACLNERGDMIGYLCCYSGYPKLESFYVGALFLSPVWQGVKYGSEIIQQVEETALLWGHEEIFVGIGLKNWPALHFWTKKGYRTITKLSGDKTFSDSGFGFIELNKKLGSVEA